MNRCASSAFSPARRAPVEPRRRPTSGTAERSRGSARGSSASAPARWPRSLAGQRRRGRPGRVRGPSTRRSTRSDCHPRAEPLLEEPPQIRHRPIVDEVLPVDLLEPREAARPARPARRSNPAAREQRRRRPRCKPEPAAARRTARASAGARGRTSCPAARGAAASPPSALLRRAWGFSPSGNHCATWSNIRNFCSFAQERTSQSRALSATRRQGPLDVAGTLPVRRRSSSAGLSSSSRFAALPSLRSLLRLVHLITSLLFLLFFSPHPLPSFPISLLILHFFFLFPSPPRS